MAILSPNERQSNVRLPVLLHSPVKQSFTAEFCCLIKFLELANTTDRASLTEPLFYQDCVRSKCERIEVRLPATTNVAQLLHVISSASVVCMLDRRTLAINESPGLVLR